MSYWGRRKETLVSYFHTAKVHSCHALKLQGQPWQGSWWRLPCSPWLMLNLWSFPLNPLLKGAPSVSSVDNQGSKNCPEISAKASVPSLMLDFTLAWIDVCAYCDNMVKCRLTFFFHINNTCDSLESVLYLGVYYTLGNMTAKGAWFSSLFPPTCVVNRRYLLVHITQGSLNSHFW